MMILAFNFSIISNTLFGILFGFLVPTFIASVIISNKIKKLNKNQNIREISTNTFDNIFMKEKSTKDKIFKSLYNEVKEVSHLVYPDKDNPIFELSINDIINGLKRITKELNALEDNPLFDDIKTIHVATILNIESFTKPVVKVVSKVTNNKLYKIGMKIYSVVIHILNIISPAFIIRKILKLTLFKQGKKDIGLIVFDYIGNRAYQLYLTGGKEELLEDNEGN